jgi:hypothetical protein
MTEPTSFVEQVSDGYVITGNEQSLKDVLQDDNYAITFVDVGGRKTADRDVIKNALSDSSKYCTLEGKAKMVGKNQVKITTDSKLTVDLKRPFATFWGVNAERLRDLASRRADESSCNCGGIPDMHQVTCEIITSVLCCANGC